MSISGNILKSCFSTEPEPQYRTKAFILFRLPIASSPSYSETASSDCLLALELDPIEDSCASLMVFRREDFRTFVSALVVSAGWLVVLVVFLLVVFLSAGWIVD